MNTINLKLYDVLRKELNLNEEKSRAITQAIEEVVKEDLIANGSNDLKLEISKIELKIEQTKTELLKWVIGCFITLAIMIIGLYLKNNTRSRIKEALAKVKTCVCCYNL